MKIKLILPTLFIFISAVGIYCLNKKNVDQLKQQIEYGGVVWPSSIHYQVDKAGDIIIELTDRFEVYKGNWPKGTKFFFDGDKLKKIIPMIPFTFSQMHFSNEVEIQREDFPPYQLYIFLLKEKMIVDGLDLVPGCKIQFKDFVLYAANCESFGTVYFKRSVELPENALEKN